MTLVQFGMLALQASIVLAVFAIGLQTTRGSLVSLFTRPGLLLRSVLAIYGVMLVVAIILVKLFHLPYAASVALIGLAIAPMPPVMPKSMVKAGGEAEYAAALLAVVGLLSIIWIPAAIHWVAAFFGIDMGVQPTAMVKLILITILAPLIVGATIGHQFTALGARLAGPLAALGGLGLAVGMLSIIIGSWGGILDQLGGGVLAAILIFAVAGLAVGHVLGGPLPEDRTVLALACSVRHPGVIAAIGGLVAPNSGVALVGLLALIVCTLCTMPYIAWRKRVSAKESAA